MSACRGFSVSIAAIAVACLALGACGDDDSEEDEVAEVVEEASTSTDPADCTELLTQDFVEQTEFQRGAGAVEACEEDAAETAADSVDVAEVEVDGDTATATAAITDRGSFGGQTVEISLAREDDQWKLDRIESFVEFDRQAFLSGLERESVKNGELTKGQARCFTRALGQGTDAELEEVFLSGDSTVLAQLLNACGVGT
jgi:hypothetical protein